MCLIVKVIKFWLRGKKVESGGLYESHKGVPYTKKKPQDIYAICLFCQWVFSLSTWIPETGYIFSFLQYVMDDRWS